MGRKMIRKTDSNINTIRITVWSQIVHSCFILWFYHMQNNKYIYKARASYYKYFAIITCYITIYQSFNCHILAYPTPFKLFIINEGFHQKIIISDLVSLSLNPNPVPTLTCVLAKEAIQINPTAHNLLNIYP
jgi:hypothetical protein